MGYHFFASKSQSQSHSHPHSSLVSLDILTDPADESTRPRVLTVFAALIDRIVRASEHKRAAATPHQTGSSMIHPHQQQHNHQQQQQQQQQHKLTIFHGLRAPGISIDKYLERIHKYANCSPSCFVVAYILLERITAAHPDIPITSLNVHRLLITSIMSAAKFLDDSYFNNAYYAKVGGVTTEEMNRLELEFLFRISFRLHVTTDHFLSYCKLFEAELWRLQSPPAQPLQPQPVPVAQQQQQEHCSVVAQLRHCQHIPHEEQQHAWATCSSQAKAAMPLVPCRVEAGSTGAAVSAQFTAAAGSSKMDTDCCYSGCHDQHHPSVVISHCGRSVGVATPPRESEVTRLMHPHQHRVASFTP